MKIEDITPERVKLAYERTGLKPIYGAYAHVDRDGNKCACALTAINCDEGMMTFEEVIAGIEEDRDVDEWFADSQISYGECSRFIKGFDCETPHHALSGDPAFMAGFKCRVAIKPSRWKDPEEVFMPGPDMGDGD